LEELKVKSVINQSFDIRYLKITRMTNGAVLQIGTSGIVKRVSKKGVFPEGPTQPLFIGAPGPQVPLRGRGHSCTIRKVENDPESFNNIIDKTSCASRGF
jgi:hypothetical protein